MVEIRIRSKLPNASKYILLVIKKLICKKEGKKRGNNKSRANTINDFIVEKYGSIDFIYA